MRTWLEERLAALRSQGKTKAGLAAALGLPGPRVHEMIRGERRIQAAEIAPMARYLQMDEATILRLEGGDLEAEIRPAPEIVIPSVQAMPKDVEVRGVAVGGKDGDFAFNGSVVDRVRRPPGIADLRGVAAIYVMGDSMVPWRQPGDLVYFTDVRPARPGDHVIVELKPGRDGEAGTALLKKLVGRAGSKLRLAQYNPPDERIEVNLGTVRTVFRVIEWSELLGV